MARIVSMVQRHVTRSQAGEQDDGPAKQRTHAHQLSGISHAKTTRSPGPWPEGSTVMWIMDPLVRTLAASDVMRARRTTQVSAP